MPLATQCSLDAFQKNVSKEIKAGRDQAQAVAIAFSTLKKACGVETDEKLTAKEIVARGGKGESRLVTVSALLDAQSISHND